MASIQYIFFFNHYKSTGTKILFLQYPKVRRFTFLSPKKTHETQIIQHLTYFGPIPDIKWLKHYPKREFWNIFSGKKFSNILIFNWLNFNSWITVFPDFSLTHLKFPDFLTFFQNSLTFPWLEKVVSFFQVFQCRWETCNTCFQSCVSVCRGWCTRDISHEAME